VYIFCVQAYSAHLRGQLSSNVRRQKTHRAGVVSIGSQAGPQSLATNGLRSARIEPAQIATRSIMSSKYTCTCGHPVRTNLYEGHGLSLLIPESLTDMTEQDEQKSAGHFVNQVVASSSVVAKCLNCGALGIVDNEYQVEIYVRAKA
jgi:hypothetical protein